MRRAKSRVVQLISVSFRNPAAREATADLNASSRLVAQRDRTNSLVLQEVIASCNRCPKPNLGPVLLLSIFSELSLREKKRFALCEKSKSRFDPKRGSQFNQRACRRVCPKYNGTGTWGFPRSTAMSDELNQLRREVARLRRDLDHVLRVIGQEEKLPQQPRPPFLLLDAEVISIRHSSDKMPILLKAEEGYACIYLNDNEGRARGLFQVDDEGSARFEIWNKDQEVVVSIGETKEGAGEIFVASADGKPRAGLKAHELGGIVSAQNSAGQTNVLMLGKDQGGTFVVADAQGRPVAEIATVDGEGIVSIKGKAGYQMAYMGCDENRGVIAVLGKEGEQAAALTSNEKGGTLVFFDPKGEPKASLPK